MPGKRGTTPGLVDDLVRRGFVFRDSLVHRSKSDAGYGLTLSQFCSAKVGLERMVHGHGATRGWHFWDLLLLVCLVSVSSRVEAGGGEPLAKSHAAGELCDQAAAVIGLSRDASVQRHVGWCMVAPFQPPLPPPPPSSPDIFCSGPKPALGPLLGRPADALPTLLTDGNIHSQNHRHTHTEITTQEQN